MCCLISKYLGIPQISIYLQSPKNLVLYRILIWDYIDILPLFPFFLVLSLLFLLLLFRQQKFHQCIKSLLLYFLQSLLDLCLFIFVYCLQNVLNFFYDENFQTSRNVEMIVQ